MFDKSNFKDIYSLSPMQQGMLFHSIMDGASGAYFEQSRLKIMGQIDIKLFERSFNYIIEKYDILRTVFLYEKVSQPVQIVLRKRIGNICYNDISALKEEERKTYIEDFIKKDKMQGFKLSIDLPMRIAVIKTGEKEYEIIWSYHHIIMDGWCLGIIMSEFFKAYTLLGKGKEISTINNYPYSDYIKWLKKQNKEKALAYWKNYLEDYEQQASIPRLHKKSNDNTYLQCDTQFELDEAITEKLTKLARENQISLNIIIQTIWGILLQRYNNTNDVVFGAVVSGRPPEVVGIESMVGLFINTIPVRIMENEISFIELSKKVQENASKSMAYDYMPLADVQASSNLKNNLFDHIIVFENYPMDKQISSMESSQELGFSIQNYEIFEHTNYDFSLGIIPGETIKFKFTHNENIYSKELIEQISNNFKMVIDQILEKPDMNTAKIRIVDDEEKHQLLADFNNTKADYPKEKAIHQLFEEQAKRTPDNIAVVYEDNQLTYRELNERANQLARLLRDKGTAPDSIVGIMAERSLEMIVGIVAILKAGGAYMPIDPEYPQDRIEYMLEDSGAQILLTQLTLKDKVSANREMIFLDDKYIYQGLSNDLININHVENLMYVIYTSGSTGKPKGVTLPHKTINNLINFEYQKTNIDFKTKVLQFTTISFDVFCQEVFSTLLCGGELNIPTRETRNDTNKLLKFIAEKEIEVIFMATAYFKYIVSQPEYLQALSSSIKHIIVAGEQLLVTDELRKYIRETKVNLHNHYGPSETHVVTTYIVNCESDISELPPIGKPISNSTAYIVDKYNNLQPMGVVGELCLAGDVLARGYLNRPELTAEKFVENPFEPGTIMYRTGDLARWLPDGNIEFLGRIDHQVKIRGFRIELGEIENKLLSHEAVKETVVIAKEDKSRNKYLCAYVVGEKELTASELRQHLFKELPDYMIPSYFIQLEKLPLTHNGKVDRKALPEPDGNITTGTEYEAPRNSTEEVLEAIWSEVLGVEKIGINDNFFELGGHSLKATSLAGKIHKVLNVEVPLKEIFNNPTIKGISEYIKGSEESIYSSIEPVEEKEYYEMSSAQKRIYTLQQFDINSTSYNMPGVFELEGDLDANKIKEAFNKLILRHEALRTSFEVVEEELTQKVHKEAEFNIEQYKAEKEEEIEELVKNFIKAFELSKAPLLRVALIKIKDNKHTLMLDMHHIISDGVSLGILTREFIELYDGKELPKLRIQYKDFAVWQNELFKSEEIKKQEEYWLKAFEGEVPVLNLPTDYQRPSLQSFEGNNINFELNEALTNKLKQIAKETGSTMYMVLLSACNVLLSKYSGQEDIIIGSPIAGRPHADLQSIMGMFVNTLAIRNYPESSKTFKEFLNEVKASSLSAFENQDYQFEELIDKLNITRDLSRNPLFDVMFSMQNMNTGELQMEGLRFKPYEIDNNIAKFDITITAIELGKTMLISLNYCTKLFSKQTIENMSKHLVNILDSIANNTSLRISELEMLSEQEKHQLLVDFNDTKVDYPRDKTIQQLFEEQVAKTPDNVAVVYKKDKLTYKELNEKANSIASILRKKGIKQNEIIGIMIEGGAEMLIGILGILKAGAAYLPIDPKYPRDRIDYMLKDSKTAVLLTDFQPIDMIGENTKLILLKDEELYKGENTNLEIVNTPKDIAYVIYTSGSTGKPKGVMIEHSSLINLSKWHIDYYEVTEEDKSTKYAGFGFDVSVWEIFPYIITGSTIHIIDEAIKLDLEKLNEYYNDNDITISFLPTQICEQFMKQENKSLRYLLAGGDKLRYFEGKNYKVVNNYGPTENTVVTTSFIVDKKYDNIPIGKPLPNTQIYIIDKEKKLQPIGIPGELCIAGESLARGYLNNTELTAEKFIENPFAKGQRMYKTGDLARWLPDGNIEFLGRMDNQVKVRGYRIELGEIENQLLSHSDIKEAIVIARDDKNNNKYLCGYILSERREIISELREYLTKELPEYMIPAYFIQLDKMPFTANGKIDRKALPEPDLSVTTGVEYAAPESETEEKLVSIWQEVLDVEKIGINDNFFELGGHSLKGISILAKTSKELNVTVPLGEMFKIPTIKGLANYVESTKQSIYSRIEPVEKKEYYELSSAQKRMYTLQQFEKNSISYNIPMVMTLEGELDRNKLEETFDKLVKRHEALRTSFEVIEGEPVQVIHNLVNFEIEYIETDKEKAVEIASEFVKAFDLSKAPIIRVSLVKIKYKEHILMIDMHHIISDGTSMGILTKEFMELYDGKELPKLRIQYKDFAVWQNKLFKSGGIKKQEEYWLKAFEGELPVLNMPTDHQRPSMQSFEGDNINFELNEELTDKLKRIAKETGSTMYMVLLSAYNVLLSKYSGQEDIVVGSPISGRPHADLENIMGMFVNTLAMRNYPESNKTFKEFLAEVKASSLQAFENQDYQFEELVDKLSITRDLSRNPLFDVMFVMQNMDAGEIQIEGLKFKPYEVNNNIAKFDMTITVVESDKTIGISLNYCTKLFNKQTMQRMSKHLTNILNNISNNISLRLSEVEMLSDGEKQQLLVEFNNTKVEYQKDKIIQQLFEEQVKKTPSNIAVVYKEEKLTYKELNEKANIIARILTNKGIKQNEVVGIMVEGSTEMIVGILGILKAGATYLPIDPKYPTDRITYMIEDSKTRILLTDFQPKDMIGENTELILLKDKELYKGENTNLEIINTPKDIAYIIYTSGSTGKPKGVMIEHSSLVNMCKWNIDYYEVTEEDNITKYAGFGFDASIPEIFPGIITGAAIHIIDEEIKLDLEKLNEYYNDNRITISFLPTQISEQFMKLDNHSLRYLLAAGDKLRYFEGKNYKVVNNYGPTENTVVTTSFIVDKEYDNIPIGKPISNTQIYILDKTNKLQAIGIPGELCIAGESLARGYLNRDELTADKFIENPFAKGQRLYKTGDLARWLPDGNIEFLGRMDNQVKVRGYRIELGEIENELLKHNKIKEAIVIAKEDDSKNKYLCAYIAGEAELNNKELREYLSKELPEYMIPAYFIQLDKLPLTANGKVDRKALPEPDGSVTTGIEYVAPSNEIEEKLVSIWKEVLGLEKVGINDNFFELGGHSLKAINITAKISKELNVSVPLGEMFKIPTIKGLANYVEGTKQSIYSRIESVEEKGYYPLSSAQNRMYTLQQFEENSISYNMPIVMTLEGELDSTKLEETFDKLIQRHEALRTSFEVIEGQPVQVVHNEISFKIEYTEADKEKAGEIAAEFVKAFDLCKAPLIRVVLTKINDQEHILMIDMPHIISDGVSMGILTKEFMELYDGKELPKLRIQYKDFAVWQNEMFKSGEIKKQEEYWLKAFEGELPVLNMPTDHQRPSMQSFEGDNINFELNEELTDKLKRIAKETGSTMYMVLLSAYNVLLSKYSGQEDIVVGSPIAGRPHADLENIMGMFVNTLAMRNYPESNKTFKEFLAEVKASSLQAFENQDYQFEELVDKLSITRDLSRNPLFDVMFVMQNMDAGEIQIEGLRFKPYEIDSKIAKFDITITATEFDKTIGISLNYCTKLFNKQTMQRMSKHLTNILNSISNNTNLRLLEVEMLSDGEKQQLLVKFNNTKVEYQKDKIIQQLFEEQVEKTPSNIAVVYKEDKLTYKELNEKANIIARKLRNKGIKQNEIVGIMVEGSTEMIVGILGILKAGATYLPIDPKYPTDRITYMIEDSKTRILLTDFQPKDMIGENTELILLKDEELYKVENTNLEIINTPKDIAYIIYTSGSTGKPKGVMIEHSSLVNMCKWNIDYYEVTEEDNITKYAGFGFDATIPEIFPGIITGAAIHIIDEEIKLDLEKLNEYYNDNKITISFLPTQISEQFMKLDNHSLRYLLAAGDKLRYFEGKNYKVVNNYGPTENTVVTTSFIVDKEYDNIPIGKPISNTQIYILDKTNKLQAIGIPGELCIAGESLARGYLNNINLTAEKFIKNPFAKGQRLYKTGDLARWLPDGNIEFLGRIDNQVKIRGYRIELGEIENELLKHNKIKEAIVIAKEDDSKNKYLCAYIAGEVELNSKELREYLSKELPEYMIPAYFIQLDKLPLTANGKIDRKALPEPDGSITTGAEYVAPSNEIEEKLVSIWKEVLELGKIGVNDNLFELGGHSLKAINISSKISMELNVSVPLKEIFKTPTIKGLASYVESTKQSIYSRIEPVEQKEYYPLSSAQKRIYTLQQFEENSTSYNMPMVMTLEGELDKSKLEEAFNKLIQRHEALRTSFEVIDGEPVQIVHKEVSFAMGYTEASKEKAGEIAEVFVKTFDLSKAPLLRVALTKINEKEHVLMLDMNHIISDGVSMGILTNEFIELYDGKELPKLRIQYKDFAVWQNEMFKSGGIQKQEEYWLQAFEGEIPVLNMPADHQRPSLQSFEGDNINFELNEEVTSKLKQISKETESTIYMVLLSACNVLLSKYSGQEDIVIGSPISGRPHVDLQNIMGMFVNTIAMRNYPESQKTFKEFLEEVKARSLSAFENQDYQFEELIDKLNITRDLSRNPLFDVMFSMQNMDSHEIQIEGLSFKPYEISNNIAKFDITITATELNKKIGINLNYCTKLFNKQTIENMSKHLINILNSIANNTNLRLSELEMLSEQEKYQLLVEFNDTKAEYPKDKTIYKLFEQHAAETPDDIAVMYGEEAITYKELDTSSNQLARTLREKGAKPNSIVGIIADRSFKMIIGIMGILKAGAAYLPIDPEYPEDRIGYILEDSKTELLLTQSKYIDKVEFAGEKLNLESKQCYANEGTKLDNVNSPKDLAYVLYTSGSTGNPKGVMIEHESAVNTLTETERNFPVAKEDVYLLKTTYTFDVSVMEIFAWFVGKGKLAILKPGDEKDISEILNAIEKYKVTHINFVPSMLNLFLERLDDENVNKTNSLKYVVAGGEALTKETVNRLQKLIKNARLENIYGPTEATIYVTRYSLKNFNKDTKNIPIGKPTSNINAYIIDKNKKLQPVGIQGELCFSGIGLGRGYLNRPELTAEKYIENPFVPGERMYKTGDLARWLPDGNIEFLGRIDFQVKIRGFRIELGEIESQLLKYEGISEAIVIAKEDKNKNSSLCSYICGEREYSISELREHLAKELPEYMIPSYIVQLDKLPLSANGKVDRKALPEPDSSITTGAEYVAPSNEIEEKLVSIWSEVLGIEKIGINDNFFELGGHSLKAINISSKINKELNVSVPLREMFKTPTIKGLAIYIEGTKQSIYSRIEPAEEKEYYPLSSAQKRMYALQQLEQNSISYNMPMVMSLEGELDKTKFEEAFDKLIQRHEALRTSFEVIDGEPVQVVHKEVSFKIEYTEEDKEKAREIVAVFVKTFDLSKAPLLRVALTKINEKEHVLMLDMNHIISDGVSMGILTKEFIELYDGKELAELRIQYKDFAAWQNELFKSGRIQKQEEYWLKAFEGELPVLNMPADHQRSSVQSFDGDNINFELNEELTNKLKQVAKETGSTMYMVLLSACNVLLSKYSGQEDIVVGSPISGRPHADLENIMGMFVNTLAMRNYPKSSKTFKEFLAEVKANSLQAFENQDYQFEELIDKLNITRDISRNPLFDVMFSMQNVDTGEQQIEGLKFKPYEINNNIAKFDITITAIELNKTIGINLNYCKKLFNKQTIENMSKHLTNILNSIVNDTNLMISKVEMLSEEEKHQVLMDFNNTEADYPREKTIDQLFEEQVYKTPDKIAVEYENTKLTYKELNIKANQLAMILQNKGVEADSIVGIMIDRSLDMIVGIMAILKAGGAYLPIDPEYPKDRIEYMLSDSNTKILLTQSNLTRDVEFEGETIIIEDILYNTECINAKKINKATDLAYIIYTSGSTGKPKGVMIEHKSVINLAYSQISQFKVDEKDRILQFSTICFDASIEQIFIALLSGAALVLINKDTLLNVEAFEEYLIEHEVTHVNAVPAFLKNINYRKEYKIKRVVSGGDICPVDLANYWSEHCDFYNEYGPTETTVTCARRLLKNKAEVSKSLSIGQPINNVKAYILDKNNNIQPVGIPGELYISGAGLARGYLNRAELTTEKFVNNPFETDAKMYKTGDLARWLPDGNIEFLGRIDSQVKVRGFRIELGEIEARLLSYEGIEEAIVIAKEETGNSYLCAYITGNKEFAISELREYLAKGLPDYMIPACFMQLEKLPLTSNGKADRKALPEPDGSITTGAEYEAPRSEIEEKLVIIWQEVLHLQKIGINDNFFELGGHSLKAINIAAKINKELNVSVPLREMFKTPTIKGLADYVKGTKQSVYSRIEPVEKKEYYELSSAQKRMYTLQQFEENNISYNMPMVITLEGQLDKTKLEETFDKLIQRHEALRTSFEVIDGEPVQVVHNEINFEIEYIESDKEKAKKIAAKFVKAFDLSKAPLIRVALTKVNDKEHILMIDMHHIISDGVSMGILTKEFIEIYDGKELAELRIQYKDFAAWQNELFKSGEIKKQEEYWLKSFEEEIPVLNLPTDYQRPSMQSFEGDNIGFELNEELTNKLKQIAKETGSTMYMVLLSACNILLSKYSGQEDIVIGSPIAGRPHADLENIMGMFVNTLAMRNYPDSNKTFKEFLTEVKASSLQAFENQDYQFEELIDKLSITRDLSRNPLFDVMFVMQNMDAGEIQIEGLKFKPYEIDNKIAKFDMTITAVESGKTIGLTLNYCTKLFNKVTIERLYKHLYNILKAIARDINIKLSDIEMLTEDERHQLLVDFNDTKTQYPNNKMIPELFEEQAARTPDSIAVVYQSKQLTYSELNEKANQLAGALQEKGVKPESIVGLMVDRSLDMIVSIMAILKAGGAYLPIDPEYPQERIEYMLEDSGAQLLITDKQLQEGTTYKTDIILLEDNKLYTGDYSNLETTVKPNNLAYVIYTSGTTGKPKGVMIEHMSMSDTIQWRKNEYSLGITDKVLQLFSYAFDGFVTSFFTPIVSGATVVIASSDEAKDPIAIKKYISRVGITHFISVPSLYQAIIEGASKNELSSLRIVTLAGENITENLVRMSKELSEEIELVNEYGPTENTVASTIARNLQCNTKVTIGKPIANAKVYILDKHNNLLPAGVAGELCVSGKGLARGYLNRIELTTEKFVDNSFEMETKMYKTGDLARWLPDGNIEFLGRIDNQVKIRGFRIELGEIESKLLSHTEIKEAIVIDKEDSNNNKYLCAYIAVEREQTVAELREYLLKELPEYMIPAYFIQLDKLPLTANGKVDRKALPEPDGSITTGAEYVAPRNEIEEKLVSIWSEVLGIEKIGINDNFFELGGHSLKAMNVTSKIKKAIGIDIPLKELFTTPTIKRLSEYISNNEIGDQKATPDDIVLIKKGSKKAKNVFIVHDGSGDISGYIELCNSINNDCNYWGIRAKKPTGYYPTNITIEEMASRYIEKIYNIQPEGSYNLVGWSLGGGIVFEIARLVEETGKKLEKLIMIDAPAPKTNIVNRIIKNTNKFSLEAEKKVAKLFIADDQIEAKIKSATSVEELWQQIIEYYEQNNLDIENIKQSEIRKLAIFIPEYESIEIRELVYNLNYIRALNMSSDEYMPKNKINTQMYMFEASENNMNDKKAWDKFLAHKMISERMPGNHFTMMQGQNVLKLAAKVKELLER